jgi:hypothetical protein
VLFSAWGATAFFGEVFGGQAALGPRLATFGDNAIYPPWAIFEWTPRFADDFSKPFALARLIVFVGFVAGACAFASATPQPRKPLASAGASSTASSMCGQLCGCAPAGRFACWSRATFS